jgi:PEP-CTERM motif
MKGIQRTIGLILAAPVAIATLVLSATCAQALVVPVKCNGNTVGNIDVSAMGTGISGGFTSTTGKPPSLAAAAKACGETQFNWYQVVTADNGKAKNAAGMALTAPYVDPPPGGYNDQWADNLPWYYDMTQPPKGAMNVDPNLQLSKNTTMDTLKFSDFPMSSGNISFSTWLVSLNADGSFQAFDGGFSWQYNTTNNDVENIMAIAGNPPDKYYKDIIGGFATSAPEPSTWVLLLAGFGGIVFLRRGANAATA